MRQFLKTVLGVVVLNMVAPAAWAGSMMIYSEWGDEIWCEDQCVAMNTLKNES